MPTVHFEGMKKDGKLLTFEKEDLCLRLMGKCEGRMESLKRNFRESTPLTATYEGMSGTGYSDSKLEIFKRLWGLTEAMQTCITPPEKILKDGDATFNLVGTSYNQVLFAMFHMRLFVNQEDVSVKIFDSHFMRKLPQYQSGVEFMDMLINDHGLSFEHAYILCISPTFLDNSVCDEHLNGADASCFRFCDIDTSRMKSWLKGELYIDLDFDAKDINKHMTLEVPYPRNIRDLMCPGTEGTSMYAFYRELWEAVVQEGEGEEARDLFGTLIHKKSGGAPDSLEVFVRRALPVLSKHFGEFNA